MLPYEKLELEKRNKIDTLLSGKPEANAWKEINNLLQGAVYVTDLTAADFKKAASMWGVSFNERNVDKRSSLYVQLVEAVFENVVDKNDRWFEECKYLGECLQLSPQLMQLADRRAKNKAYASRCHKILTGEEKMDIHQLNDFFGYDYDDGLAARREVFEDYFYKKLDDFEKVQRYTFDDEKDLVEVTQKLDVPFELKENLMSALVRFRNLWNAETQDLQPIQVQFPLNEGEACYAGTNSGRCVKKKIQEEDDFFDRNRKFNADDTLTFKGAALDTNKQLVEHLVVEEIGYFFITNQRLIFASKNNAVQHAVADVAGADFKDNCIYFHLKNGEDVVYKYSDDASECMFMIFNRVLRGEITKQA